MYGSEREILGYRVVMTSSGCPETYMVLDSDDDVVGSLYLRYGMFSAFYELDKVYHANPKGDGVFYDDEREFYLKEAVKALHERHVNVNN